MPSTDLSLGAVSALPVALVIAISGIVALSISDWLAYQIARSAIDKSDPAAIPLVLEELSNLLSSLSLFLPWSRPASTPTDSSDGPQSPRANAD